jgi:nucleoside-diphosphate-sugar epimerase
MIFTWRGKNCLVTGGVGFFGSHLSQRLADEGARTTVLDIEPPHPGTYYSLAGLGDRLRALTKDCATEAAIDVIQDAAPDYIFHLAGLPYAPYTTRHRAEAYAANVHTTKIVLEAARRLPRARVVLASSACVFGATQESPLAVNGPRSKPEHYYTITKREAEVALLQHRETYGTPAIVCRFGNIYGPGDRHFGRIVPRVCAQLLLGDNDRIVLRRSRGDSTFEFLYVADAVEGILQAAAAPITQPYIWQFSGGRHSRSDIAGLAGMLSELCDGVRRPIETAAHALERTVVKFLDTGRTEEALGFSPTTDLKIGLSSTLNWYRDNIRRMAPHTSRSHEFLRR